MIYHKKILLDQFTPIAQYDRLKALFKNEISFLFESAVNNERGNYSYIIVGVREKVWHENNKSYYPSKNNRINKKYYCPFIA
jgi:anthranilate synthase component 1